MEKLKPCPFCGSDKVQMSWTLDNDAINGVYCAHCKSGYIISEATKTVCISGKRQDIVTVDFTNNPQGSLLIKKLCALEPGKTLKGAVPGHDGGGLRSRAEQHHRKRCPA